MRRILYFIYGVTTYTMFFGVFLYTIGFVGNFIVPKSMDSAVEGSMGEALVVNLLLVLVFSLQHTVMARPTFKKWWTQFVPKPIERSTYVLFTNLAMILLFWQWRPMGGVIWDIQDPTGRIAMYGLFASGWLTVLVTTFLINHFDLFGLRQVWLYLRGKEYTSLGFRAPGPYKVVRHPLYVGWMTAFWATPTMTTAHLAFAIGMTGYMLVAIWFEERNLVEFLSEYADYRKRVPMLIPRISGKKATTESVAVTKSTAA